MVRFLIYIMLISGFSIYSYFIYTSATETKLRQDSATEVLAKKGKLLYQQYNCQSCHQVFGLGGYLGPDLTRAYSDRSRGEKLIRAVLRSGGNRMPDFNLNDEEVESLVTYLKHIDAAAGTDTN